MHEFMSISCPSVRGFGMTLTGGRCNSDGSTSATVTSLERGGNADKSGLCLGKTVNVMEAPAHHKGGIASRRNYSCDDTTQLFAS